ncbi:MAG: hypothetical protein WA254_00515 [Candidatus Sulfotelmatobacter sp.]
MSVRNALVSFLALSTLSLLVGCGSSGNSATPPPSGGFTTSSLSGTYVFSFSGIDITNDNLSNFAVAGTLVASSGNFSSGSLIDINDPALNVETLGLATPVQTSVPVTGSYVVGADGRGNGTLNATINGNQVQFGIDFVLNSTSGGLITRFDSNGTGSGTINLQTAGVGQSAMVGSYSFGLNGADPDSNPLGAVGSFTLDANGNATGTEDFNDDGISANLTDVSLVSPSAVLAGSPGTAQLDGDAGLLGALTFDVWVVNSSQLVLIETDSSGNILAGDAFASTGQTAFPSGQVVFTMTGGALGANIATETPTQLPLFTGGLFTAQGGVISNGIQDANIDATLATAPSVGGAYSSVGVRTSLTLTGIYNIITSEEEPVTGSFGFAAYPFNGGVFLLEADNLGGIEAGVAYPQTSTSLAASQGYALNLSGANSNGEVDMIAEFVTNSSGGFSSGLYDANNMGSVGGLISNAQLNGNNSTPPTYANNSNGRGMISFPALQTNDNTNGVDELSFLFYAVNDSTLIFMENDTGQGSVGTLQLQNASGSSGAIRPAFSMVRPAVTAHGALRKKQK